MNRADVSALYERYGYAVHRRCLRILGSQAEADDALQEVFIRVMKYGNAQTIETPLSWLNQIASRHCFDMLSKRKRTASPSESERALAAAESCEGSSLSPEDIQSIAQVLEVCRSKEREVAVLYYFDQLTQEEVAARIGVSRKTVKQRLAKFLEVARKKFGVSQLSRRDAA